MNTHSVRCTRNCAWGMLKYTTACASVFMGVNVRWASKMTTHGVNACVRERHVATMVYAATTTSVPPHSLPP
eukprot:11172782-Lingulodinium_polyedra.AAC.1